MKGERAGGCLCWALVACLLLAACAADEDRVVERSADETTSSSSTSTTSTTPAITTTASTATTAPLGADACPPPASRRQPDPRRPTYRIEIAADPTTGVVTGRQDTALTPDLPIDSVVFRLWANGPRPASVGSSITVTSVTEAERPRPLHLPDPTTAVVSLDRTVQAGEEVRLRLEWTLQVNGPVNDRISRQGESLRLGSFVPLLAWQPGVGWATEPPTSGFAEATTSPTADWVYTITAPERFGVVGSGVRGDGGAFHADLARDIAVAVGRFTTVEATAMAPHPVIVTVSAHDGIDDPGRYLGQVVGQIEELAERYGPYPWPTYALSLTAELSGGIEFPMHVLQGPDTSGRTTPHEVAHMWFYGLVGNNQALHPYLDEGLATYVEGRLLGTLDEMTRRSIPADGRGRAGEPMTYWEGRSSSYYRSVYVQPAAALAGLHAGLVDCALARYVAQNAHRIAVPDDLARALDEVFRAWRPVLAPAGLP